MERFFKLKEHGTNVRTEIIAGITTFMTMAYILVVNNTFLGPTGAGMPSEAVFFCHCGRCRTNHYSDGIVR